MPTVGYLRLGEEQQEWHDPWEDARATGARRSDVSCDSSTAGIVREPSGADRQTNAKLHFY